MRRPLFNVALLLASLPPLSAFAADETMIRNLPLQSFFHSSQPWRIIAYQPSGQDASIGDVPAHICFVNAQDHSAQGRVCKQLILSMGDIDSRYIPLQTIDSVDLVHLPSAHLGKTQPAIVVRASFSGGGPGMVHALLVWSTETWDAEHNHFQLSFQSQVSAAGAQAFVTQGPLAGDLIRVDQIYTGDEPDMAAPVRYTMDVYRPVTLGWQQILSIVSQQRWPNNHLGLDSTDPIAALTPEITRALHGAYPDGLPALDDIPAQH
ncbi:hypothetical protein ACYJW8_04175 [Frateuria aurantia]